MSHCIRLPCGAVLGAARIPQWAQRGATLQFVVLFHARAPGRAQSGACVSALLEWPTQVAATLLSVHLVCLQAVARWLEGHAAFLALLLLLLLVRHLYSLVQLAFLLTSTASSTLHLQV